MGEIKVPHRSGAESSKGASVPKFTPLPFIKIERDDAQLPLHTTYKASPTMNAEQQPVAAQCVLDAVEIIKFESITMINIKKEIQNIKDASMYQKRLKEKYPELDDTPVYLLEEIERLQNLYAVDGDDYIMEISSACRNRLCVSRFGPWLNLSRLSFPRRKKGARKAVKEYIIVPLFEGGPLGSWKPYDEDADPDEPYVDEDVLSRMEAFEGERNPFCSPPDSVKSEEEDERNFGTEAQLDTSDSELSSAQSMESIEFDESFGSSAAQTVNHGTQSTGGQLSSSPLPEESPSPQSSPFKLESASPSPTKGSSTAGKTRSRVRKQCKHCGTIASISWRNGPVPDRNRCMNSSCGLSRDR